MRRATGLHASLCLRALVALAVLVVAPSFALASVSVERYEVPHGRDGAIVPFVVYSSGKADKRLPFLFGLNGVNVEAKYYSNVSEPACLSPAARAPPPLNASSPTPSPPLTPAPHTQQQQPKLHKGLDAARAARLHGRAQRLPPHASRRAQAAGAAGLLGDASPDKHSAARLVPALRRQRCGAQGESDWSD